MKVMSIRVLQIIPTLVRGGAEKQLTLLACGLPRDEFDVHVAVLTHDGPYHETLSEHGIPVTVIGKRWKVDPASYFRLRRWIVDLRPDLVHTWIFAANSYGRAAALSAGVRHVVAGERCIDPWKTWQHLAIDRWLARRTARIVTNSSGVRDFYHERGIPAEKFVVIPNGIANGIVPSASGEQAGGTREDLLRELGLPDSARLIGAVGRLWPQKRYKDLIWAAELLNAGRGDTYFLIVGGGPQRDELESYCDDIRIEDRVRFLGERADVPRLLKHLDCFWLGSGYEGQSNALMEAMLAGVPVVATDIAGNRDLVVPEETGFLVPVGDAGQFARKTHQFFEDRELARRCGENARRRMCDEFSVSKMIERHRKLYREIIG
jgi:glycosyltransferase involved in cell wall biosynthesis